MAKVGTTVTISGLDLEMKRLVGMISPARRLRANKIGARASQQALKKYHKEKGRKMWLTPGPTHGPGRRQSGWYKQVAAAWGTEKVTADGAGLVNGANYFSHKVRGGVIKAKRVRFLTIPVIPEAHGRTARQFAQEFQTKLFTIKGSMMLFMRGAPGIGDSKRSQSVVGRTIARSRNGRRTGLEAKSKITAIFALKRSVNQKPTPGALPSVQTYLRPFSLAMADDLLAD